MKTTIKFGLLFCLAASNVVAEGNGTAAIQCKDSSGRVLKVELNPALNQGSLYYVKDPAQKAIERNLISQKRICGG